MERTLLLAAVFLAVSAVFSMLGLGGGILYVPILLFAGYPFREAPALSLVLIAVTSATALFTYWRHGRVDWRLALVIDPPTDVAAFLGGWWCGAVPEAVLRGLLAAVLLVAGGLMLRGGVERQGERGRAGRGGAAGPGRRAGTPGRAGEGTGSGGAGGTGKAADAATRRAGAGSAGSRRPAPGEGGGPGRDRWWLWRRRHGDEEYAVNLPLVLPATALIGLLSGMLGITGGILKLPIMVLLCGVPMDIAVGTSTAMVALTALSGLAGHVLHGPVAWGTAGTFAAAALAGGFVGSRVSLRLDRRRLRRIFGLILWAVAARLLLGGAG